MADAVVDYSGDFSSEINKFKNFDEKIANDLDEINALIAQLPEVWQDEKSEAFISGNAEVVAKLKAASETCKHEHSAALGKINDVLQVWHN